MENQRFVPGDPILIEHIVNYLKAKGIFDEFRHDCLADVDTKSSCQNLSQRVDGYTTKFLLNETWNPELNKNELRNKLRRNIDESGMLTVGADHVVEQVINPKISQLFLPNTIEVVHQYLKEENEKLNKKQELANETSSSEKSQSENTDGSSNKTKTPVLDPIADILSFTYSKPKPSPNITQKSDAAHKKITEVPLKTEKKKEEVKDLVKNADVKVEKKEEENSQLLKNTEINTKVDQKESAGQIKNVDIVVKLEKQNEDIDIKSDSNDSFNDKAIKSQTEPKEIKVKTEIKAEELVSQLETQKKIKEESKVDKKKVDDGTALSEHTNKYNNSTPKSSSSSNKPKSEVDKSKKLKTHISQKMSHSSDHHKQKSKEYFDGKAVRSKSSLSKSSKSTTKQSSSSKSTFKSLKREKSEDGSLKSKSTDSHSKSSDSSTKKSSSKFNSIKKENTSSKSKHFSDKHEKERSPKKSNIKHESSSQSSSATADKGSKNVLHYSSSLESSQGSDQDKSQSIDEKPKHFSKHHKKDRPSPNERTSFKLSKIDSDLKCSHKTSDQVSSKKHKGEKTPKITFQEKLRENPAAHDSAKISSRSNSFGSTSSTSDSSKDALPSSSEDGGENTMRQAEKKKKGAEKERCLTPQDFPPPPPPPPPSSDLMITETTSSSHDEMTQSSQESESESESSEESNDSDAETGNSEMEDEILLYSSSSSDFEGYISSPEPEMEKSAGSDTVSSVHTSDLSSYEDEFSFEDLSSEDIPHTTDEKGKKKISLKNAREFLQRKEAEKNYGVRKESPTPCEEAPIAEKTPEHKLLTQISVVSSEEEISPRPEPRREMRRERKLNPKYASNEYTSIFNSKRTSFITKQSNLSPQTHVSNTSSAVGLNSPEKIKNLNEDIPMQDVSKKEVMKEKLSIGDSRDMSASDPEVVNRESEVIEHKIHDNDSESKTEGKEVSSNNFSENNSSVKLTLNIKNSPAKTKNNVSKDLNPNGMKRKCDVSEKVSNKRLCNRNSVDSNSSKSVVNENEPLNNEKLKTSIQTNSESKGNLHKQKANGDVLGEIDHLRKSSHSKSALTSDKN